MSPETASPLIGNLIEFATNATDNVANRVSAPTDETSFALPEINFLIKEKLHSSLEKVLIEIGFCLIPGKIWQKISHHRIPIKGGYLAVPFVKGDIIGNPNENPTWIGEAFAGSNAKGFYILTDLTTNEEVPSTLKEQTIPYWRDEFGLDPTKIFTKKEISDFFSVFAESGEQQVLIKQAFDLDNFQPDLSKCKLPVTELTHNSPEVRDLTNILEKEASTRGNVKLFFEELILSTQWNQNSQDDRIQNLTGLSKLDTQQIIKFCLHRKLTGTPKTAVGSLIQELVIYVDQEGKDKLQTILTRYDLI